jgi:DNA-binding NtrC family response regulator
VILLLEPDAGFRSALAEILRDDGHEVLEHAAPAEVPAQAVSRATGLIVHCHMPSSSAAVFADRFHAAHPAAPVIAITSYSTPALESHVAARPFMRLLRKPMEYTTLVRLLEHPPPAEP